ncbi:MAG: hypothetical protein M0C28_25795, partial [Candidatus Moduliflexus flocculans]|nr:hypothetical protein [Candidatus Moduliflexus flocculans]
VSGFGYVLRLTQRHDNSPAHRAAGGHELLRLHRVRPVRRGVQDRLAYSSRHRVRHGAHGRGLPVPWHSLRRLSARRGYLTPGRLPAGPLREPRPGQGVLPLPGRGHRSLPGGPGRGGRPDDLDPDGDPLSGGLLPARRRDGLVYLPRGFGRSRPADALQLAVLAAGAAAAFAAVPRDGGRVRGGPAPRVLAGPLRRDAPAPGSDWIACSGCGCYGSWRIPSSPRCSRGSTRPGTTRASIEAAILYPFICGILFLLTVGVGVAGRPSCRVAAGGIRAGLPPAGGDPARAPGGLLFALAAVSTLMSTLDSQLLSLSSMIVQDFASSRPVPSDRRRPRRGPRPAGLDRVLSPPDLILDALTGIAFPAYAVLAPRCGRGWYGRRAGASGAASLVLGLALVVLESAGRLTFGPGPPAAVNLAAQALVLAAFGRADGRRSRLPVRASSPGSGPGWLAALAATAALRTVAREYGAPPVLVGGVPRWVWLSAASCGLLRPPHRALEARAPGLAASRVPAFTVHAFTVRRFPSCFP